MFSVYYLDIEEVTVPAKCLSPINFAGRMRKHINKSVIKYYYYCYYYYY